MAVGSLEWSAAAFLELTTAHPGGHEGKKEQNMKVIEKYRCEVCNTEYTDRKKAEACENCHKQPVKITDTRYLPIGQNRTGYPVSVTIKMSDGEEVIYKR